MKVPILSQVFPVFLKKKTQVDSAIIRSNTVIFCLLFQMQI